MVTDRCATTCLILVLCFFYPHWILLWQTVVALDISSHWIQMYMSLLHGETTHKVTDLAANPVMRFYYSRVRGTGMIECQCISIVVPCLLGPDNPKNLLQTLRVPWVTRSSFRTGHHDYKTNYCHWTDPLIQVLVLLEGNQDSGNAMAKQSSPATPMIT